MDHTQARRAILARLKAGEITEEEADTALERLLNPPKRGRGRPKKKSIFLRTESGELVELRGRYRRKPSLRELEIGRHYVEQVEAGIKPMAAMRNTLKEYSTKRNPLEVSSVRRYVGLFKKCRQERIELMESGCQRISMNFQKQYDELLRTRGIDAYISRLESERALNYFSHRYLAVQETMSTASRMAREHFTQVSDAALSRIGRGFEVGHKK